MPEETGVKEIDYTLIILKILEKNIWAGVLCFALFFGYKIFIKQLELKEKKILSLEDFREEELDARLDIKSEEQFPKVVMAPNAAEYFEKLEMEKAIAESQRTASLAG